MSTPQQVGSDTPAFGSVPLQDGGGQVLAPTSGKAPVDNSTAASGQMGGDVQHLVFDPTNGVTNPVPSYAQPQPKVQPSTGGAPLFNGASDVKQADPQPFMAPPPQRPAIPVLTLLTSQPADGQDGTGPSVPKSTRKPPLFRANLLPEVDADDFDETKSMFSDASNSMAMPWPGGMDNRNQRRRYVPTDEHLAYGSAYSGGGYYDNTGRFIPRVAPHSLPANGAQRRNQLVSRALAFGRTRELAASISPPHPGDLDGIVNEDALVTGACGHLDYYLRVNLIASKEQGWDSLVYNYFALHPRLALYWDAFVMKHDRFDLVGRGPVESGSAVPLMRAPVRATPVASVYGNQPFSGIPGPAPQVVMQMSNPPQAPPAMPYQPPQRRVDVQDAAADALRAQFDRIEAKGLGSANRNGHPARASVNDVIGRADPVDATGRRICRHWLRGKCNTPNCHFSHNSAVQHPSPSPMLPLPNVDVRSGPYQHVPPPPPMTSGPEKPTGRPNEKLPDGDDYPVVSVSFAVTPELIRQSVRHFGHLPMSTRNNAAPRDHAILAIERLLLHRNILELIDTDHPDASVFDLGGTVERHQAMSEQSHSYPDVGVCRPSWSSELVARTSNIPWQCFCDLKNGPCPHSLKYDVLMSIHVANYLDVHQLYAVMAGTRHAEAYVATYPYEDAKGSYYEGKVTYSNKYNGDVVVSADKMRFEHHNWHWVTRQHLLMHDGQTLSWSQVGKVGSAVIFRFVVASSPLPDVTIDTKSWAVCASANYWGPAEAYNVETTKSTALMIQAPLAYVAYSFGSFLGYYTKAGDFVIPIPKSIIAQLRIFVKGKPRNRDAFNQLLQKAKHLTLSTGQLAMAYTEDNLIPIVMWCFTTDVDEELDAIAQLSSMPQRMIISGMRSVLPTWAAHQYAQSTMLDYDLAVANNMYMAKLGLLSVSVVGLGYYALKRRARRDDGPLQLDIISCLFRWIARSTEAVEVATANTDRVIQSFDQLLHAWEDQSDDGPLQLNFWRAFTGWFTKSPRVEAAGAITNTSPPTSWSAPFSRAWSWSCTKARTVYDATVAFLRSEMDKRFFEAVPMTGLVEAASGATTKRTVGARVFDGVFSFYRDFIEFGPEQFKSLLLTVSLASIEELFKRIHPLAAPMLSLAESFAYNDSAGRFYLRLILHYLLTLLPYPEAVLLHSLFNRFMAWQLAAPSPGLALCLIGGVLCRIAYLKLRQVQSTKSHPLIDMQKAAALAEGCGIENSIEVTTVESVEVSSVPTHDTVKPIDPYSIVTMHEISKERQYPIRLTGWFVYGVPPIAFSTGSHAEFVAACNRLVPVTIDVSEEVQDRMLEAARTLFSDLASSPASFLQWNARFPAAVQKINREAYDKVRTESPNKSWFIIKTFLKREILLLHFGVFVNIKSPRVIQSFSPEINVQQGPAIYGFSKAMAKKFDLTNQCTYAVSYTGEQLGYWYGCSQLTMDQLADDWQPEERFDDDEKHLAVAAQVERRLRSGDYSCDPGLVFTNNAHIILADISNMDGCQTQVHGKIEATAMLLGGVPPDVVMREQVHWRRKQALTPHGVYVSTAGRRATGGSATSCGNTLQMFITNTSILTKHGITDYHLMALGDDTVLIDHSKKALTIDWTEEYKEHGFNAKVARVPTYAGDFCSARFWATQNGIVLGSKPGRFIGKTGMSLDIVNSWESHALGTCLSLENATSHVPICRAITQRALTQFRGVKPTFDKSHRYKVMPSAKHQAGDHTFIQFESLYSMSKDQVLELEAKLISQPMPYMLSGTPLVAMCAADNGRDFQVRSPPRRALTTTASGDVTSKILTLKPANPFRTEYISPLCHLFIIAMERETASHMQSDAKDNTPKSRAHRKQARASSYKAKVQARRAAAVVHTKVTVRKPSGPKVKNRPPRMMIDPNHVIEKKATAVYNNTFSPEVLAYVASMFGARDEPPARVPVPFPFPTNTFKSHIRVPVSVVQDTVTGRNMIAVAGVPTVAVLAYFMTSSASGTFAMGGSIAAVSSATWATNLAGVRCTGYRMTLVNTTPMLTRGGTAYVGVIGAYNGSNAYPPTYTSISAINNWRIVDCADAHFEQKASAEWMPADLHSAEAWISPASSTFAAPSATPYIFVDLGITAVGTPNTSTFILEVDANFEGWPFSIYAPLFDMRAALGDMGEVAKFMRQAVGDQDWYRLSANAADGWLSGLWESVKSGIRRALKFAREVVNTGKDVLSTADKVLTSIESVADANGLRNHIRASLVWMDMCDHRAKYVLKHRLNAYDVPIPTFETPLLTAQHRTKIAVDPVDSEAMYVDLWREGYDVSRLNCDTILYWVQHENKTASVLTKTGEVDLEAPTGHQSVPHDVPRTVSERLRALSQDDEKRDLIPVSEQIEQLNAQIRLLKANAATSPRHNQTP